MAVMLIAVGVGVAAGFALGAGIGGNGESGSVPTAITTRDSALKVPTLSATRQVPALESSEGSDEQPAETAEGEEATAQEEPTFEPEQSEAGPQAKPEVTVAPNG